jgi:SNF2 family DNA or RNA helicase
VARHRWCLTGTPIQNTIEDLGSLVSFLRVAPFDEAYTFRSLFVQSYSTGETSRWKRLRALVRAISLRRTKAYVGKELDLPPRKEYVEPVSLDPHEQAFYNLMKKGFASAISHYQSSRNCFQLILRLRQICNHGIALLPEAERDWMQKASIYAPEVASVSLRCENCDTTVADESDCEILSCFHQICLACLQARGSSGQTCDDPICPICCSSTDNMDPKPVDTTLPPEAPSPIPGPGDYSPSSKVKALLRNLAIDKLSAQSSGKDPPKR